MKKDSLPIEWVKLKSLNIGFSWQDSPVLFHTNSHWLTLIKSVLWVSVLIYDMHFFFSVNAIPFFHINFKKTSRTLKAPTLILILFFFFFLQHYIATSVITTKNLFSVTPSVTVQLIPFIHFVPPAPPWQLQLYSINVFIMVWFVHVYYSFCFAY